MILVVTKKRYERDLQEVNDIADDAIKQMEEAKKETNILKQAWLKEKITMQDEIHDLTAANEKLTKTKGNYEALIAEKDKDYNELKEKYKTLSNEKGGLKSTLARKDKKIKLLEDKIVKSNPELYKVKKLKAQKTPKLKVKTIIKNQKNSQVKAQLKSIGETKDESANKNNKS